MAHMGVCQNYGFFLGSLNNGCHIIIGIQKGTIILTTTHMSYSQYWVILGYRRVYRVYLGLI